MPVRMALALTTGVLAFLTLGYDNAASGQEASTIRPGRHLKVTPQPLNNLYLSMLDRMETPVDRLGDSTGRLNQL